MDEVEASRAKLQVEPATAAERYDFFSVRLRLTTSSEALDALLHSLGVWAGQGEPSDLDHLVHVPAAERLARELRRARRPRSGRGSASARRALLGDTIGSRHKSGQCFVYLGVMLSAEMKPAVEGHEEHLAAIAQEPVSAELVAIAEGDLEPRKVTCLRFPGLSTSIEMVRREVAEIGLEHFRALECSADLEEAFITWDG